MLAFEYILLHAPGTLEISSAPVTPETINKTKALKKNPSIIWQVYQVKTFQKLDYTWKLTWFVARWLSHSHGVGFHGPMNIHTPAQRTQALHLSKVSILQTVWDKVPIHNWGNFVSWKQTSVKSHLILFKLCIYFLNHTLCGALSQMLRWNVPV